MTPSVSFHLYYYMTKLFSLTAYEKKKLKAFEINGEKKLHEGKRMRLEDIFIYDNFVQA